ncbi:MAG TPA: SRPBCC family protein [Candidatus Kapabacteria bacterium]|jgi:activator of HSP90 ATPase|nr:SRPBCC family protein [Candidatus Kapabacteria bacterium]
MAKKTLKQTHTFNASAKDVYEAFMDSRTHAKFTGAPAKISAKEGGKFTAFGGMLEGTTLELKPNKKIVQSWRSSDWPEGHYSRLILSFASAGRGKTRLTLTQSNIPDNDFEGVKKGWISFYWEPMTKMFEG